MKTKVAISEFLQKRNDTNIKAAVEEMIQKTKDNNGRLPKGEARRILKDLQSMGIEINRDRLYYLKEKQMKEQKEPNPPVESICIGTTEISTSVSLSMSSGQSGETENNSISITSTITGSHGRPKGTTIVGGVQKRKLKLACINEITKIYSTEMNKNRKRKEFDLESKSTTTTLFNLKNSFLSDLIVKKKNLV